MTYPNAPLPPTSPEMQALWDRAMLIARTRGAYGCAFPQPGTSFRPPTPGTMLHDILFVCTATGAEVDDHLAAVRENMIGWKARVAASGGKRRESIVRVPDLDVSKLEITL